MVFNVKQYWVRDSGRLAHSMIVREPDVPEVDAEWLARLQRIERGPNMIWVWAKRIGITAGALVSLAALWHLLDFPTPAWSTDIQKLNRRAADTAVDLYQSNVRSLLAIQPPTDPSAKLKWEEELRQARQKLDASQTRVIELSK